MLFVATPAGAAEVVPATEQALGARRDGRGRACVGASASAPAAVIAPPAPAPPAVKSRWDYAVIPLVFYAPETSLGLAVGVALFDDTPTPIDRPRRDDNLTLVVQGTLRKQFTVGVERREVLGRWRATS